MAEAQLLRCPSCREPMRRQEELPHPDGTLQLEMYACEDTAKCGRKAALWWELTGKGVTAAQMGWVEREVAARGSFFPGDYTGNTGGPRRM